MKLDKKKKLAADILGVGVNRVWVDPARSVDISSAITREDIRGLIKQGAIKAKPQIGISRGRLRVRALKRKVGRRGGPGTRKGASGARTPKKANWIKTVRPLRLKLKELRKDGSLGPGEYRKLYLMVKGGSFKSKAHLVSHLKEKGILK
jgi:large subunit ribosomal protein L19e